jgi:hypothetical protein
MKSVNLLMSSIFILAGAMETTMNPVNAFTLFVIAMVYFRGLQRGNSYIYTASLLAVVFAVLSLLVMGASFADSLLSGTFKISTDWGLIGFVSLPMVFRIPKSSSFTA